MRWKKIKWNLLLVGVDLCVCGCRVSGKEVGGGYGICYLKSVSGCRVGVVKALEGFLEKKLEEDTEFAT